jgi:hypothetical protein
LSLLVVKRKQTRKEKVMKSAYPSKQFLFVTCLTVLTCWNGSVVESNSKDKRPDVNFYGTLLDHASKAPAQVENILIGGKYKNITFYADESVESNKTADGKIMDPKQNKTIMDLEEIEKIELAFPDKPIEHERTINSSKFSVIKVTSINGSSKNYLVESSRDLTCTVSDKGSDSKSTPIYQERKLNMIHVKSLIIKGKKSAQDVSVSRIAKDEHSSDKVELATSTEKILDEIEEKVNDLPKSDPSQYEKFKQSMISLLRSLREQLQKMLALIKS